MRRSIRKRSRTSDPTNAPSISAPVGGLLRRIAAAHGSRRESSYSPATNQLWRAIPWRIPQPDPGAGAGRPAAQNASRSFCGGRSPSAAGLLILILIVLGVKGCLNARKHRALSDYARNVTQIVEETEQTSKGFFDKLADPGELSVTEFVAEVNADRSAMDNYAEPRRRPRRARRHGPRPGGARTDLRPARQRDDRNRRTDQHRARRRRRPRKRRRRSPAR